MFIDIFILAILILINGFFTASELSIFSLNQNKIKLKANEGDKRAILINETLKNPDNFIPTIQIVVSTTSLFVGAYGARAFSAPIIIFLYTYVSVVNYEFLASIIVIFITIILSYFTLVFGELVPKRIALNKSEQVARATILPVIIFSKLCRPIVLLLSYSANLVLKLLRVSSNIDREEITEEEIRMMVDVGKEVGNIDAEERQMINNIFEFDDKIAEEIGVHRTDIVSLDVEEEFHKIIDKIANDRYSRIPVYEGNIDNIIGILHIKDIMKEIVNNNSDSINIRNILKKPYFVPASKNAHELFKEMKNNKVQLSILIDEYGGTAGIITMEDLIEEVMGDILDEYDSEEIKEIREINKNTFIINGVTSLEDVNEMLLTSLPDDEYDTLGGFVIGKLGRIPDDNEIVELEIDGFTFKIIEVNEKRIKQILVKKIEIKDIIEDKED